MKICFLNYHESQAMASRPPLKSSQQEIRKGTGLPAGMAGTTE